MFFTVSQNTNWNVSYIGGGAAGSIYTQDMSLAGISISGQAFGSANRVDDEPLSSMNVSGILGLSVPVGSFIQTQVAGNSAGNDLDTSPSDTGSILPGLLGSITGSRRMFGLGLQRLPSDGGGRKANSSLAIRGVDPAYVPDGTPLNFNAAVISDSRGLAHHWNLYVTGITVTANGSTYPIPASFTGLRTVAPTAVIDSAAALSYAPAELLNALYGAFIDPSTNRRIGPGDNGIYYVPCTLPLNISMTVGGVTIPIHPLDASLSQATPDTSGSKAEGCIGSFQAVNAGSPAGADIVLGAPFIRSAYTVFSCDTDDSTCSPSIAFYPTTTNSSQAFEEFKQVRVQGEQLGSNSGYGFESLTGKSSGGLGAAAKIAIGIVVSIVGLLAIFGVVVWWARRRAAAAKRRARESGHDVGAEKDGSGSGAASFAREGWDSDSPDPSAAALSAKEQQRLREAALLHGYFDEDIAGTADDERGPIAGARPVGSGFGASPAAGVTPQWDVSSKGYVDARRVRREYLERHPSLIELRETSMSRMPREASQPQQQHTIADSATLHPPEDEADAEFSTIDNVIDQRRSTTSSRRNLMNPPQ